MQGLKINSIHQPKNRTLFTQKLYSNRNSLNRARTSRALKVRNVIDVTPDTFENEVLKSDKPVLVDFWADWCGPCKLINPLIFQLEEKYGSMVKVVKMDVDKNKDFVKEYKVYGLPTVLVFKDGKVIEDSHREGAITLQQLFLYVEKYAGVKLSI
eukprot:TRINITY_DN3101_c0_g3_i1.p1 TRINITY_DN3101_c0_g3~~TRINITY_DN3101_c0_g3_i1.p1  ORF type:complete len:164 (-),score=6.82 TRINITY_DN3101_c0_g3_i1:187-651(-)